MSYLIGIILGDLLGRIGFFRAAGAALLLGATAFVAYRLVASNLSGDLAWIAAGAAPVVLFTWAAWNPAASKLRLWLVDGVYLAARLAMWVALIAVAEALLASDFRIDLMVLRGWLPATLAGILWGVQWVLGLQTARSHRIMGDRSVVEV